MAVLAHPLAIAAVEAAGALVDGRAGRALVKAVEFVRAHDLQQRVNRNRKSESG
jgi:hypothetical protein